MSATILITGATDGIGLALARLYAEEGARLLLVGRRPLAALQDTLFSAESYCQADLAQPDGVAMVQGWLASQGIHLIDRLIHNAAIGYYGSVADQSPASVQEILALNLYTPIALTHALLSLVQSAQGKVVFISSVVSALPSPDYAVYAASKAALDGFARSLRVELGERVQVIRPGATRTAMHQKLGIPTSVMDWRKFPSAEQTAQKIHRATQGNRPQVTVGVVNQLLRTLGIWGGSGLDRLMGLRPTGPGAERRNP